MIAWLYNRWARACSATIGTDLFWLIAVDHRSIYRVLSPWIDQFCRGTTLDAGAGRLAWRSLLMRRADRYLAVDSILAHTDLDIVCDLQGSIPLRDASIDTIFCCSVLEHTLDPWKVMHEFRRLLTDNGHVILSVPFLYYLHGAPDDFYRFTPYGIRYLAERARFEVLHMHTSGGFAHAVCHATTMLLCALLWTKHVPWLISLPARLLEALARHVDAFDRMGLFSQTVNVVLRVQQ